MMMMIGIIYMMLSPIFSSPSLAFFFNRIHLWQLSYCLLTATLIKRYTIVPKKKTLTLDPSLNEQLSILCVYRSQWTPSTRFIIEEFTGILLQHRSKKESFWERRPKLSHTFQVGREHSDLTYNKYCSLCRRPLLEGSKATWSTILSAAAQTVVGREQSNLIDNTTYCHIDCCGKGA